jgi:hypothetical protein
MEILCIQFYADVPAACQHRCRAGTAAAANGSSTNSPGRVKLRIRGANASTGFCVGCSLLPLYGMSITSASSCESAIL